MAPSGQSLLIANKLFTVDPQHSLRVPPQTFERANVMNTEHLFVKEVLNHFISYYICSNKKRTVRHPGMRMLGHPLDSLSK